VSQVMRDVVAQMEIPAWCFQPDNWSIAFLRGLGSLAFQQWDGRKVWEVGVGSGVNIAALTQLVDAQWYFSDYDSRCTPLAMANLSRAGACGKFVPLEGSWDLVTPPAEMEAPKVNVIFGCLPQVPVSSSINLSVGDNRAHYYDPRRYPEARSNELGLGIVQTLLQNAKQVLLPRGTVVLNLGGRPGRKRLLELFIQASYVPDVVNEEVIQQHPETSVVSLATLEESGQSDFEFFLDEDARYPISARSAETLREAGTEVFHKIYVIAGTTLT